MSTDTIWVLRCTACGHPWTWIRPDAEQPPFECPQCHAIASVEYESTCYCWGCRPEAFPPIPAEGTEYVAIQVERCRPVPEWATLHAMETRVLLNGETPRRLAIQEAQAGVVGWVVALTHDLNEAPPDRVCHHFQDMWLTCPCGSGLNCQMVHWGYVTVERVSAEEVARLRAVGA